MKSPIQEKLDQFRRLWRRLVLECTLETLFLTSGVFFLAAELLDYILWSQHFLDLVHLRQFIFLIFVLLMLWELRFFRRSLSCIPHSRQELLHCLNTMKHQLQYSKCVSDLTKKTTITQDQLELKDQPSLHPQSLAETQAVEKLSLPSNLENALDFLENPQPEASRELAEAVIAQAEREMEHFHTQIWIRLITAFRFRWPLRLAALLTALTLSILSGKCGENAPVALQRFLPPWDSASWQIDFSPQWKTLPKEVLFGETFDAELLVQRPAPFVLVHLWENAEASEPFRTLRVSPFLGRFLVRIPNVRRPFHISISLPGENIQKAPRHAIRLGTRPNLTHALLRIQPPAILRQPPSESGWEISGLTGSRIGLMIAADRPLKDAKIRFTNGTYIPGEPAEKNADRRVFKFRFELLRECSYFLELTDENGIQARLETHTIRVLEDERPSVRWTHSIPSRLVLPGARLRLSMESQDDFGIASLGFRWVAESPVQKKTIQPETHAPNDSPAPSPAPSPAAQISEDGFIAPRTQNGTLKWTGLTIWEANTNTALNTDPAKPLPYRPLPLFHQTDCTWDLSAISLTPGMRLRAEPLAADADLRWEAGQALLLHIATPDEMQRQTFRRWVSITQELRQIGNHLKACREMLTDELTPESAPDAAGKLMQTMELTQRLLDPAPKDGLPQQLDLLTQDLEENPAFPFHENLTSKDQLPVLRELSAMLAQLQGTPISALNQEVVQFTKTLRLQKNILTADLSRTFGRRIAEKLDALLQLLEPQMRGWKREEYFDVMRFDFTQLQQAHALLFQELAPCLKSAGILSPMEIRMRDDAALRRAETKLWNLNRELKRFLFRFGEMLEPASVPQDPSPAIPQNSNGMERPHFASLPPLAHRLLEIQEMALLDLHENRFWDLQKRASALHSAFREASSQWISSPSSDPVRDGLQIFAQMRASQEKILQLLESCLTPERTLEENQTPLVPLTRNLRMTFRDCAELQTAFSRHFASTGPRSPKLPRALSPHWDLLCENLLLSIEEFRAISQNETPPLEKLEDQFTLQLQIFDQLAELALIAEGMPSVSENWLRNTDFENRLETKAKDAPDTVSQTEEESPAENENAPGAAEKTSNELTGEKMLPQIEPADIQVLIAMQKAVYTQTKELLENQELSASEKAAEVEFQTAQERKIAASADLLGFGAKPNTVFDTILAQIYQVVFLLEKQDLGPMTFSIQEEILYGLRSTLQKMELPDESKTEVARTEKTTEDLSQSTDPQSSSDEPLPESEESSPDGQDHSEEKNEEKDSAKHDTANTEIQETMDRVLNELQNSYWGELPQRQKEELKLIPKAEPIPGYQKMLEHYYRNLRE